MSLVVQNAEYWKSFEKYHQIPDDDCGEVVFAGRSNAGKSSAINVITNQKKLAHTSKLPGRTRLLNFFKVTEDRFIVDLPGYGYAKVSEAMRNAWARELTTYLSKRHQIRGLFAVMDIRHAPTVLDEQMVEWFSMTGKPIHVLLTKSDKLNRVDVQKKLGEVSEILVGQYSQVTVQVFSSLNRAGLDEARAKLIGWLS
ncbi:MAG: ribosome biogenesis GTP-binding protein YihA/YsxC [Burkholderiales bacterium]|jgi:GTP-binding protein|nr:ribosome biogenesis GTP-binding protein YihA/YsxC [Pseudomonadota bacterium]MDA1011052.1 ribosome biogenesis GTP-binding protein YihA/YsxC [Pseudomonadota bacterium]|tara:strand:+ start:5825 stop:6418 length:594 start_codon:yes stop_codon:yes gene_type:complete